MPRVLPDLLSAYGEYTEQSESPQAFHLWCALSAIAGAAQRKMHIDHVYFKVYTNLYVALTSPPGVGKKTTAMRVAKNFLKQVEPQVNFSTESGSFEGLVDQFKAISKNNVKHQSLTAIVSELGSLLSTNAQGMVDFLTDIYDGNPDWNRQTKSHGKESIPRPWLNLVTGTTPGWMGENLSNAALEGGFVARTIFTYTDERILKTPRPKADPRLTALEKQIVNDLSHIATLEGEFTYEDDAGAWYDEWYMDESRFPKVMDFRTSSYFDRKHMHLLKVAMLLSLSYKDELVLTLDDLQRALMLLNATEPGMKIALSAVGRNPNSGDMQRVLAQIKMKGAPMHYGEIVALNYHNMNKEKIDETLDVLRAIGKIAPVQVGVGKSAFVHVA